MSAVVPVLIMHGLLKQCFTIVHKRMIAFLHYFQKQIVHDLKARSLAGRHGGTERSQKTCHVQQCDASSCSNVLNKIEKHTKNHEKLIRNTIQSFRQNRK
jgi:hypothetical protein